MMANFKDLPIKSVMEEINQSYFIPDIQREYVWLKNPEKKKIEQLFDSLLRGYPISSFLIWKLKKNDIEDKNNKDSDKKLNIQLYKFIEKYDERKTHNEKIDIDQVNSNDLYIVLDGQQRLTSLYIGLKGSITIKRKRAYANNPLAYEEKKLYVNLKHIPNYDDPDDNYEFKFLSDNELSKAETSEHWFKVGDILKMNVNEVLEYSMKHSLNSQEMRILSDLMTAFCLQSKISCFDETEKQLDKVLKIFIRVNSGGTELSYSDLLMSILTANFSSDIRDMMNVLVDSLKENGYGIMGRDHILKTCLLLTGSNHIFHIRNFKRNNISKIEEKWDEIQKSIFDAVKLLNDYGYKNRLSSGYIITALAYFYFIYKTIDKDDTEEAMRFVRMSQVKSYFSSTLDKKLEIIGELIKNSKSFKDINKKIYSDKIYPLYIIESDVDRFLDYEYGNSAVFSILQVLYPHLDYKNSTFHIDHIYPKSKFKNSNKLLDKEYIGRENDLFNLQLLSGEANLDKRAKDPEVWVNEIFTTNDAIVEYKKRNYIKEDLPLLWENIQDFENYRNEVLLSELKKRILQ